MDDVGSKTLVHGDMAFLTLVLVLLSYSSGFAIDQDVGRYKWMNA